MNASQRTACLVAAVLTTAACSRPAPAPETRVTDTRPAPTFTRDVAPILNDNCVTCHRQGQPVPFTLLAYADVKAHADKILDAVRDRHMPPWLPDSGTGPYVSERRLRDDQIDVITRWVNAGAPEGDAAALPAPPVFAEGWQLGQPDLVVTPKRAYTLQSGKEDVFRNLVLPVSLASGRYVRAVEFRPGAAPVVHHAVISLDRTRASRKRDGVDGQAGFDGMIVQTSQNPDGHFLGWAPGRGPIVAPTDMAWKLDQGADLVVQMHLLPQKTPVSVRPSIGLYFTDTPPARAPLMVKLGSKAIDIPAGSAAYEVTDRYVLPVDVDVLSVFPHAHYLGHEMHAIATLPDGTTRTLLRIGHWDFHWQQDYRFVTPVALPRGTTLAMRYTYDNSVNNEHNPQKPPKPVTYGPNSSDEMGDLWLQVLPHSAADAAALVSGVAAHEAETNVTAAELLVRHAPDDAKNQTFLGGSYFGVGRHADAVPHLEKAIQIDPRSASAHNYLGGALLPLGRTSEAIAQFRLATSLAPDDERMQFNLGMALNASGSAAEAEKAFARAVALNSDFADAHHNLGVLLLTRGQTAPAIDHLRRTVALDPNSADAHNDLGGALASAGRVDEAIAEMKRALDLRPGDAATQQNLAILQQRRGR